MLSNIVTVGLLLCSAMQSSFITTAPPGNVSCSLLAISVCGWCKMYMLKVGYTHYGTLFIILIPQWLLLVWFMNAERERERAIPVCACVKPLFLSLGSEEASAETINHCTSYRSVWHRGQTTFPLSLGWQTGSWSSRKMTQVNVSLC